MQGLSLHDHGFHGRKVQEFCWYYFDIMAEEGGDAPGEINVAEYFSQMGLNKNVIKR
jgi:hypothetical protein